MKSTIFWDITPCSSLKVNRRFGGTYCLLNKSSKKLAGKQVASRVVCIRYHGNVSTKPLPSNDRGIFTEPLPSNERGIFTEPLPSNDRGGYTQTHTQQRDLINLLYFSKIRKIG
jgi:hypothetical protein